MTKSKTKLLKVAGKGTVPRSVIRKAVEKAYGIDSSGKKAILKKAS